MSERRDKKQVLIPAKPRADEWVAQGREKPVATGVLPVSTRDT